ncbi:cytochrome d ubiquinol oxidase subunit II [Methylobacterium sp. J-068]|uniref:cytochrome d ubiquinol oxidase subunit II n=1 Tax=Methylobacterium sp. J-068 TaxID=2836649 RepID=UPI001FBB8171|nr:cytochrome d ubiquinol oxidase subunit II [Methylobacterium sp. J-068]MCJ2032691.1 cytochrome d ubiquinol oxidase subunit II [Methylobacterium sp. J-068]
MFGFGMEYEGAAFWLPLVWAGLLAVAVAMYVVIDGFDLGVGILFASAREGNWRDRMMLSVAPIWDGNETWLVLGGGGLFAVFSVAYAILLPALYLPLILMLIALIFRGVAFEFRFKADRSRFVWDNAFHYGSLVATFAQGMVLGAFVQGFQIEGRGFTGGTLDWLTPFSVLTGIGLVCGYGLLGATWCVMKTSGELEVWARRKSQQFLAATIVAMTAVSAWVPFLGRDIQWRWVSWPNILYVAPVPLVTALVAWGIHRGIRNGRDVAPFLLTIALFLLGFLGLAISLFPYIVPPRMTIWQAANAVSALQFALVGYAVVMPLTLAYTGYAYWVFRGKVAEDMGSGGYGH